MRSRSADSIEARSGRPDCNKAGYKAANCSCHVRHSNPLQTGGVHINGARKKQPKYSPEVIERAVRMVSEAGNQYESQWAEITWIAAA